MAFAYNIYQKGKLMKYSPKLEAALPAEPEEISLTYSEIAHYAELCGFTPVEDEDDLIDKNWESSPRNFGFTRGEGYFTLGIDWVLVSWQGIFLKTKLPMSP